MIRIFGFQNWRVFAVAGHLHKVAAGDLGLENKEYSNQPGEEKQVDIQKKFNFVA